MLLLFSGLVHVRVRVGLVAVPVVLLMLVGRVGMRVDLVTVLVLVLIGRFVGVLGHRVPRVLRTDVNGRFGLPV